MNKHNYKISLKLTSLEGGGGELYTTICWNILDFKNYKDKENFVYFGRYLMAKEMKIMIFYMQPLMYNGANFIHNL